MKLIKLKARTKKGGYHSSKEYVEAVYKIIKKELIKLIMMLMLMLFSDHLNRSRNVLSKTCWHRIL